MQAGTDRGQPTRTKALRATSARGSWLLLALCMLWLLALLLLLTSGDPAALQPSRKTVAASGEVMATQSNPPACSSDGNLSLQDGVCVWGGGQQVLRVWVCCFV